MNGKKCLALEFKDLKIEQFFFSFIDTGLWKAHNSCELVSCTP